MGDGYTLFLRNDGTVWATGSNDSGQLGVGIIRSIQPYPGHLEDGTPLTNVGHLKAEHHTLFFETMGLYGPRVIMIWPNWVWGIIPIETTPPRSS